MKEMHMIKKIFFLFYIYKMYLISAERYKNAEVDFLRVRKTDEIWVIMKIFHDGLDIKNMSNLVFKEIYGKYERKNLIDNEIKKYKMTEREVSKKYEIIVLFFENEMNSKNNKEVCQ